MDLSSIGLIVQENNFVFYYKALSHTPPNQALVVKKIVRARFYILISQNLKLEGLASTTCFSLHLRARSFPISLE